MARTACSEGCGRRTSRPAWPEGVLCATCATRRVRRRGVCGRCGQTRSLPANSADGKSICASCAGITEDLRCRTCGSATAGFRTLRQCTRCSLRGVLERCFDEGSGKINSQLLPVVETLASQQQPKSGLNWMTKTTTENIRALATGQVPLTHEGIDRLPASNSREHLRELLVAHAVLPSRNRYLAAYERWAERVLAGIEDRNDRRLIAAFLRWHIRPRLERRAATGELTESRYSVARAQTNIAVRFLAWLHQRGHDLGSATQADIDVWLSTGPATRLHSRTFIRWAMTTRRSPTFDLPPDRSAEPRPMPEQQRLALLDRLLHDDHIDLVDRVAGSLVVLYALPSSRIHRLRLTDLHAGPDGLMVQLGADPVPVPAPLSDLLTDLAGRHTTRPDRLTGEWLFPGRIPGQPIEPDQLVERLNRLGITRAARTAALNALLRQVPSPVLAKVLNRRPWRVTARAKTLGTDWSNYAALRART
jgi:hypothetical protein